MGFVGSLEVALLCLLMFLVDMFFFIFSLDIKGSRDRYDNIFDIFSYIYIYIYIMRNDARRNIYMVHSINFQTFLYRHLKLSQKILYVIVRYPMRWQTIFYDFRSKSIAKPVIGIHPTKAWLSQLVNFKNAIWMWGHFRRTICNRILF